MNFTRALILSLKANVILVSIHIFYCTLPGFYELGVMANCATKAPALLCILLLRFLIIEAFDCEYPLLFRLNYMAFESVFTGHS